MTAEDSESHLLQQWSTIREIIVHWCPLTKFADLCPTSHDLEARSWPDFIYQGLSQGSFLSLTHDGFGTDPLHAACFELAAGRAFRKPRISRIGSNGTDTTTYKKLESDLSGILEGHWSEGGDPQRYGDIGRPIIALASKRIGDDWERSLGLPQPLETWEFSLGLWIPKPIPFPAGLTANTSVLTNQWCPEINISKRYPVDTLSPAVFLAALERYGQAMAQHSICFVTVATDGEKKIWFHSRERIDHDLGAPAAHGWGFAERSEEQRFVLAGGLDLVSWRLGTIEAKDWKTQLQAIIEGLSSNTDAQSLVAVLNRRAFNNTGDGLGATFHQFGKNSEFLEIQNAGGASFLFAPLLWNNRNQKPLKKGGIHLGALFGAQSESFPTPHAFDIDRHPRLRWLASHQTGTREALCEWRVPANHGNYGTCSQSHDWKRNQRHHPWPPKKPLPAWINGFFES